ncbi:hypothetical protein L218DRAFT_985579 [Marasmius fiardii PR-910]|nr:hypothetical protein L218DRAFT_985579 [Marasmius fiardii PR-910]
MYNSVPETASPTILCKECKFTFLPHRKISWHFTSKNLRENYVPNSTEASLLTDWIDEAESEKERYTLQIDKLRSILEKLEVEKAYLQRYIDEYRTLLSPIRKLPPEILTEIFLLCCQAPSTFQRPLRAPPMVIAQTCSFWRRLALDTPLLWASFHINLHSFPGNIQLLSTYLNRSKDMPLAIELDYTEPSDGLILAAVLEHSWRWKHFLLHDADRLNSIDASLLSLPSLHSLELSTVTSPRLTTIFKNAPMLRTLILDDVSIHSIELENLPCSQLTSVTVKRAQMNDALHVLRSCPNLEKVILSTRNFSQWGHAIFAAQPIRLSSLTTLTFTTEVFSLFLKNVVTPSLTMLTIATPAEPFDLEAWPQNEFIAYLQKSVCPLQHLSLVDIELSDDDLLSIFQYTPLLTHLSVKENPKTDIPPLITNRVLRRLTLPKDPRTATDQDRPPLLHLQFIDFVTHASRIDYGLMIDLLSSRSSPLAKSRGFSVLKDISARQGFIDVPESDVPHHIIPRVGVPLRPLIDGLTNRIFALGGSIITPVFSSIRVMIPGIS